MKYIRFEFSAEEIPEKYGSLYEYSSWVALDEVQADELMKLYEDFVRKVKDYAKKAQTP